MRHSAPHTSGLDRLIEREESSHCGASRASTIGQTAYSGPRLKWWRGSEGGGLVRTRHGRPLRTHSPPTLTAQRRVRTRMWCSPSHTRATVWLMCHDSPLVAHSCDHDHRYYPLSHLTPLSATSFTAPSHLRVLSHTPHPPWGSIIKVDGGLRGGRWGWVGVR